MIPGANRFIFPVSMSISILVNGAMFYSFDHSFYVYDKKTVALKKLQEIQVEKEKLEFTFVEAPPKIYPQKPSDQTKHMAARDALNQDLLKIKPVSADGPAIKNQSVTDQLAQVKAQGSPPTPEIPPSRQSTPQKETPKETKEELTQKPAAIAEKWTVAEKNPEKLENESKKSPEAVEQKPVKASQGLTGADKITTQEFSKYKFSGAKLYGMTSFEATGSGMGEYMKNLKEKVWLAWFPNISFKYPQDFYTADVVLGFVLDAKGEVKIVQILEDSGNPLFAGYCMDAIQRAGNFGPLPPEILALIGKEELEIKFGFHYR